jgi:hypothetical protein
MTTTSKEVLRFARLAVEQDTSLETGRVKTHARGILVEVMPLEKKERTEELYKILLHPIRQQFDAATKRELEERTKLASNPDYFREPTDESPAYYSGKGGKRPDPAYARGQAWLEAQEPLPTWEETLPSVRDHLATLPETPLEAVMRARQLIVDALNGDSLVETGEAAVMPNDQNRFALAMHDGSHWIGSVSAFQGDRLRDLAALWPERPQDAPGIVVLLLVRQTKGPGAVNVDEENR